MLRQIKDYVEVFLRSIAPASREEFGLWWREHQVAQQKALEDEQRRDKVQSEASQKKIASFLDQVKREKEEFEAIQQEELAWEQEQSRTLIESMKVAQQRMHEELRLQAILRGPGWVQQGWWEISDGYSFIRGQVNNGVNAFWSIRWAVVIDVAVCIVWFLLCAWALILFFWYELVFCSVVTTICILWVGRTVEREELNWWSCLKVAFIALFAIAITSHPIVFLCDGYEVLRKGGIVTVRGDPINESCPLPTFSQCRQWAWEHTEFIPRNFSVGETVSVSILGGTEQVCVGFQMKYSGTIKDVVSGAVNEKTGEQEGRQLLSELRAAIRDRATKLEETLTALNNQQKFVDLRSRWKSDAERQVIKDALKKELWHIQDQCVDRGKYYFKTTPSIEVVGVPVYQ